MATIVLGAIVTDIAGSVGGSIFSRNANGAYVKNFTKPHNANTERQQEVRADFSQNVGFWRTLTPAQQQLWADATADYAYTNRLGQPRVYTAPQLFNSLNQTLAAAGVAYIETPLVPQSFTPNNFDSADMVLTAGVLTTGEAVLSNVGAANETAFIWATASKSNGKTRPGQSEFRLIKVQPDLSAGATIDFITQYQGVFGDPQLDARVFVRVEIVNISTGQRLMLGTKTLTISGT